MLDVHPPHAATHTWKDFFLHIATICVGLLIAIGLEQTVEALHHHHQLAELREALQRDNEKALRDDEAWESYLVLESAWLTARMDDGTEALRTNTTPHFIPEPEAAIRANNAILSLPVDPTWKAAKASNLIDVMPQDDVKAFAEIDVMIEATDGVQREPVVERRRQGFETQFHSVGHGDVLDFSRATRADVVAYVAILGEEQYQISNGYRYCRYLRGALQAVLRGERDLDKIDDEENKVRDGPALAATK